MKRADREKSFQRRDGERGCRLALEGVRCVLEVNAGQIGAWKEGRISIGIIHRRNDLEL
jgi:hypothetical protein